MTDQTITIRFKGSDEMLENLVTAWLEDEGVTIAAGSRHFSVDLSYVKGRGEGE